jgi:hypothetical protein
VNGGESKPDPEAEKGGEARKHGDLFFNENELKRALIPQKRSGLECSP